MRLHVIVLCLMAVVCAAIGAAPTQAQNPNLLVNPAFDPPWSKRYDSCKGVVLEEVQVPYGWEPFYACQREDDPPNINRTPEYRMVSAAEYSYRVRSAPTALRYFNFWALNQSAGVFQVVPNVRPGNRLRFSMWVQLWTTNVDLQPPTSQIEPGNLEARLCMVLDGGAFTFSNPSLVCSPWSRPYDVYEQLAVEGTATASQVVVVLHTRAEFPVKHNDVMADDAELVVIGQATIAPRTAGTRIAPVLIPTDKTMRPPTGSRPQAVVNAIRYVDLRAQPTMQSLLITRVGKGTVLSVLGISADKQWRQVIYGGKLVWIMSAYTLPNATAQKMPVVK